MTFKELEALMVKHGAVIRAITENERIIVEIGSLDEVAEYLAGLEEV